MPIHLFWKVCNKSTTQRYHPSLLKTSLFKKQESAKGNMEPQFDMD